VEARQWCAQAVVPSRAEAEVWVGATSGLEAIGIREDLWVAVCCCEENESMLASGDWAAHGLPLAKVKETIGELSRTVLAGRG
jgi:hypothetical protein